MRNIDELVARLRAAAASAEGLADAIAVIEQLGRGSSPATLTALAPFVFGAMPGYRLGGAQLEAEPREMLSSASSAALESVLSRVRTRDVVGLDQQLRSVEPGRVSPAREAISATALVASVRGAKSEWGALVVLSASRSGYVREAALPALARHGAAALPWLLVRCVDWVAQVSERASREVTSLLPTLRAEALLESLPLLHRLAGFSRANPRALVAQVEARLLQEPAAVLDGALLHRDVYVRRAALRLLAQEGRLETRHLHAALDSGDGALRSMAAGLVSTSPLAEAHSLRLRLCDDHAGQFRALGLRLITEARTPDALALLENALDDPHWLVRATARHELRGADPGRDFADRYRSRVRRGELTLGVVRGLGDEGHPSDWELLVPALDAQAPSLASSAIQSMTRLDRRASREMRTMMVDDARPRVSSTATRSLRGEVWASDDQLLRSCLESPLAHVRENGALLLLERPGWDSIIAVLASPHPLGKRAHARLLSILGQRALKSAAPSAAELAELRRLVASPALSQASRERASSMLAVFAGWS